jgi:hemerythrin
MSEVFFKWEPKYNLNINSLDDEHKTLVKIMNEIYELNSQKKNFSQILPKISELARGTQMHFKNEEDYFSSINYPKAAAHKMIHKDLLTKFTEHVEKMKTTQNIPDAFFMFLKVWLSAHILGVDTGYANIENKKAI